MVSIKTARYARLAPIALVLLGLAGLNAGSPRAADTAASDDVKLESLKFDAFKARLVRPNDRNHKYTLVDVWSTTCAPCMENFPHLVEMNQKYAGKGLQTISLSIDDTTDAKAVETARAFLRKKKATFLNVLLDEEFGAGYDKLDINTIPAVFLYDRDGKLVKKYTLDDPNHQFEYKDVEKDVAALMDGKSVSTK